MPHQALLEVTFRGVEIRDETVYFIRRCFLRMQEQLARSDRRVTVMLYRADSSMVVRVVASVGGDGPEEVGHREEEVVGHGEDVDELLAVSSAFAVLHDRLLSAPELGPFAQLGALPVVADPAPA